VGDDVADGGEERVNDDVGIALIVGNAEDDGNELGREDIDGIGDDDDT